MTPYEPRGVRFWDVASGREMLLVGDGEPFAGWLCFRGPDGQWVTQREATPDDIDRIADAPYFASHPPFLD
jgi:hypothetical protein